MQPELSIERTLRGFVMPGRGLASGHLVDDRDSLLAATGQNLAPGSLNLVLGEPVMLDAARASTFALGHRAVWPAMMGRERVWIYRWMNSPLHVLELLAATTLRDAFGLADESRVEVSVEAGMCIPLRLRQQVAWHLAWKWRERWIYRSESYVHLARRLCAPFDATQKTEQP